MKEPVWFKIKNIDRVDTPALLIYKERMENNLAKALQISGDPILLRPHVKTSKIAEVCSAMLKAGITKFKAATIAECEMLAMIDSPDVLLAYQPTGPKLDRFISLINNYPGTNFSCLADNEQTVSNISDAAIKHNISVTIFIDLNIGMNRSGIKPENAIELARKIVETNAVTLGGLHAYDGHIHDTDLAERRSKCLAAMKPVTDLQVTLETLFNTKLKIIAGGTPTFGMQAERASEHFQQAKDRGIIECSPGTFIFWDHGYNSELPDLPFEPAAVLATRIVSIVDEQTICIDLGHKSVASEMPFPRVQFLNAPGAVSKSHSEEHMTVTVSKSSDFRIGEIIYCIPRHICPTVALYEKVFVVENQELVGEWKTVARNRYIHI